MENKEYFTPNIEDMCIGYEYEIFQKGKPYDPNVMHFMPQPEEDTWIKMIYPDAFLGYNLKRMFEIYQIRVPYLTKEQIEDEGWTYKTRSIDLWFERKEIFLREDGYHLENIKLQYGLHDYRLKISFVYVGDGEEATNAFLGECKDINTFRKIIKLLGI